MSKVLGIAQFAKAAGVEESSARVMLRKIEFPRKERSYEFKSMDQIKKLIEQARNTKAPAKKAKPASKKKAPAKKKPKPAKKKAPKEEAKSED